MPLSRRGFLGAAGAATTTGLAAAAGLIGAAGPARADTRRPAADPDPAAWMSEIPDATALAALTIPGTHDTCCTDPMNGTEWSHCQNMGIPEQLRRGIRFFDIRCGTPPPDVPDEFGIYHGSSYQDITFNTVLDRCRAFLSGSPGETVLMRVKNEHGMGDDAFSAKFDEYLGAKGYRDLFWTAPRIPELGEVRGKVVLITQFPTDLKALTWPAGDNGDFSNEFIDLQDDYDTSVAAKKAAIRARFDAALDHPGSGKLSINFTSLAPGAQDGLLFPKYLADQVMPDVLDYLDANRGRDVPLGTVPMDFPDFHEPVMQTLINWNFSRYHR